MMRKRDGWLILCGLIGIVNSSSAVDILKDNFDASPSITDNSRIRLDQLGTGWVKNSPSLWTTAAGTLANAGTTAGDASEGPIGQLVSVSGLDATNTLLNISFDYTVGTGSTLYFHLTGLTTNGAPASNEILANTGFEDGNTQGFKADEDFGDLNLLNGSPVTGLAADAVAFAADSFGTYTQTINLSTLGWDADEAPGLTGSLSSIRDFDHLLALFASNVELTDGTGAISIDNFEISASAIVDTERPEKPNFVLMLIDDLGWQDVGCYDIDGNAIYETPYLDALAAEGVRFTQAYSPAQVCAPSRAGIMGGLHPARQQITSVSGGVPPEPKDASADRMMTPYFSLRMEDEIISLPEALTPHGYMTGHSGKWHINGENKFPYPADQGFQWAEEDRGAAKNMGDRTTGFSTTAASDDYQLQDINGNADEDGYAYDQTTEDALTFLREAAVTDQPFFCFYSTWLVHYPIQMRTERLLKKYSEKMGYSYPLDGTEDMTADGQVNPYYGAMIETVDYYVHRLMTYLEETDDPRWPGHKLIENTYVVFTSDNGGNEGPDDETYTDNDPLQEGKKFIDEGGIRVPFMVWGPGVPKNLVSDVVVNGLDLYPTMLALAGIEVPERLDGMDLSKLLLNDPTDASQITDTDGIVRDSMFWHSPHGRLRSSVRKDGWKLIKNWDHVNNPDYEPYSLYQLYTDDGARNDFEEATDLYSTETVRAAEMAAELEAWLIEVDASTPHYNPACTNALPHQSEVPAILDAGQEQDMAYVTWETHKADVETVELIYTLTEESNPVKNGEWFDLELDVDVSSGRGEVEIPEGTTYYLFNVIDTNNFLVSSSSTAYVEPVPYLPSQDAVLIQSGTTFPTEDVLIANEAGTKAAAVVKFNDATAASMAMGQTFTVINGVTLSKLTLKVAADATYDSASHQMALWIGETAEGVSGDTKVFEWVDLADTTLSKDHFITIDFSDETFWPGTYAFQLMWPTNDAANHATFYRSAADEYADGELLKAESDAVGEAIDMPFNVQGDETRDVVFAFQGEALSGYTVWANRHGIDRLGVTTDPELNTVSIGDPLLRDDVGFYKASASEWTVTNGIIGNAGTVLNDASSEGAIGQIIDLSNFTALDSSELLLSFDYTTASSVEELFVHLWGYVDVSSVPTTPVMTLGSKRGRAWEQSESAMVVYNLGQPNGAFTSDNPGDDADAAAALTGADGAQVYSRTFDLSGFTTAPTTIAGYDYLVLGFARDIESGAAVEIENVVLQAVGGDTILSFVPQAGDDLSADLDGDGLDNFFEFAYGGDPLVGGDDVLPVLETSEQGVDYIYRRRLDAQEVGLTYELNACSNLVSAQWSTDGVLETGTAAVDADYESVTNRVDVGDIGFIELQLELSE